MLKFFKLEAEVEALPLSGVPETAVAVMVMSVRVTASLLDVSWKRRTPKITPVWPMATCLATGADGSLEIVTTPLPEVTIVWPVTEVGLMVTEAPLEFNCEVTPVKVNKAWPLNKVEEALEIKSAKTSITTEAPAAITIGVLGLKV